MYIHKKMMFQEQIKRKVTRVGNGAHIFVPKEWDNDEVMLVRTPKLSLKEELINILSPHLENIVAVLLYGSYARKEQVAESDIDVFVISDKKFKIKSNRRFDIIVIEQDKLEMAAKLNPILFYSMLKEAKPVINSFFLGELQKSKINFKNFKEFIESSKRIIKMDKEIIELDKLEGKGFGSNSTIYSLILRLRGIFLINQLLKKKLYSNKLFKEWVIKKVRDIEYEKIYGIYRIIRDGRKTDLKIKIKEIEKLMSLFEKELKKLEEKIKNAK